jgi:multicomponent Na+:H+ antiporter subunit D
MTDAVPPVIIFVVGALLLPFIPERLKVPGCLLIPVVGFVNLMYLGEGTHFTNRFSGFQFVLGRVDKLSLLFAYIFHLISFIAILYALHVKDNLQQMAGLMYAGAPWAPSSRVISSAFSYSGKC